MAGTTSLGLPTYAVGDPVTPLATILTAISNAADAAMVTIMAANWHMRARSTTSGTSPTVSAWTKVNMDVYADYGSLAPWAMDTGARTVTVTNAGVYSLAAVVSMSGAAFATRIVVNGETVAQSPLGSSVSFTNAVATTRRLAAGAVVQFEVYPSVSMTTVADSASNPCCLTITRVGA